MSIHVPRYLSVAAVSLIFFLCLPAAYAQDGTVKWNTYIGGNVHTSPALAPDGYLYAGSHTGWLHKIDVETGESRQLYHVGGNLYSSPAIGSDGTIYTGSLYGYLHAVNPDGSPAWPQPFYVSAGVSCSPAVACDGTVYVGGTNGRFWAVNPDGTPKWSSPLSLSGAVISSPAVGEDGTVYVGTTGRCLYAISPDGTMIWSTPFSTSAPLYASPAIDADGTIYIIDYNGYLYAINPEGTQKWCVSIPGGNGGYYDRQSSPAIGPDGTIYVGAYASGRLYAVDPSSAVKWYFSCGYQVSSPAVGADGTVYVGTMNGYLFGITDQGGSGVLKSGWPFSMGGNIVSSPAIDADGTVYIGSYNGRVYAVYSTCGGPADSPWSMFRHDVLRTGSTEICDCLPGCYGPACEECPGGAEIPCSGHGVCDDGLAGTGVCTCERGFTGFACDGYTQDCEGACAHTRVVCEEMCYVEWNGQGTGYDACMTDCLADYDICLARCSPVFWNRLGSEEEVHNSPAGPGLIIDGNIGFRDGVSGGALYSKGGWYCDNRTLTPINGLQLDPQRGTVEAWVKYPLDPIVEAYNYSMFSILDGKYQKGAGRDPLIGNQVINYIGDGTTGDLFTYYVTIDFGNPVQLAVPNMDAVFGDHAFHHVAVVWNKEGIDGSGDTIRLYIDDTVVGTASDSGWGDEPDVDTHHSIGKGENIPSNTDPDIAAFIVDEVKVWHCDRTVFDTDQDGVADSGDNCPETPNGPLLGTCTAGENAGQSCAAYSECGDMGYCSMDQEDTDGDGTGDVCHDCEGACARTRAACEAMCEMEYPGEGSDYNNCMSNCEVAYNACIFSCSDSDQDGVSDDSDNCPETPNGPQLGTCTAGAYVGDNCTAHSECGSGGYCSMNQEDADRDGIGDVCYEWVFIDNETVIGSYYDGEQQIDVDLVEYDVLVTNGGDPVEGARLYVDVEVIEETDEEEPAARVMSTVEDPSFRVLSRKWYRIVSGPADKYGRAKLQFFKAGCRLRDETKRYTFKYNKHRLRRWFPRPAFGCCQVYLDFCSDFCMTTTQLFCNLKNRLLTFSGIGSTAWSEDMVCNRETGYCEEETLIVLSSVSADPGNKSVIISWQTGVEIQNAGFNVYRAGSEKGPYQKINNGLIAARGSPSVGASYTYEDSTVRNRKEYYYKIEDIDFNGASTMHGPVTARPLFIYHKNGRIAGE